MYQPTFSRQLLLFLLLLYFGACCCVLVVNVSFLIQGAGVILITIHFFKMYRHHLVYRDLNSVRNFYFDGDHWRLNIVSGQAIVALLQPTSVVTRYFQILYFKNVLNKAHYRVILFPDSLQRDKSQNLYSTIMTRGL